MRSRSIVRELIKQVMEADADDEKLGIRKPKIRKVKPRKVRKSRKYPDEVDDDPD
jgi:hypothetical protein